MGEIRKASPLQAQIDRLEVQRAETLLGIKNQLRLTGQSLKPANILRDAAKDVIESRDLKKLALKAAGAVLAAFLLKQIIQKSHKQTEESREQLGASDSFLDRMLEMGMPIAIQFFGDQLNAFMARRQAAKTADDDSEERETENA
jgi:hypothetical protein